MAAFFDDSGSRDGAWVLFFLVTLCASMFGRNALFVKLQIPNMLGYMIIGFLFGPFLLGAMSTVQVGELKYVSHAALSFIAISAGAEIYVPEILPLLRPIAWISGYVIVITMVVGTALVYSVSGTPLLPWLVGYNSCNFGVAMLIAVILATGSPTSVLAIVRELQTKGEITSIIIGFTVAGDVVILTIFAVVSAMTQNFCSGTAFNVPAFMINLVMIPVSIIWGFLLGYAMEYMLKVEHTKHLILPLGFLMYLICDYILAASKEQTPYHVEIDALLICIAAGFVVGNSPQRDLMVRYLHDMSPYVFIPFFTAVGLQLDMPVLVKALGFSLTASAIRALCMAAGTYLGGIKVGFPKDKAARLWMGLVPQAGVSLGLATIVGHTYEDTWGYDFQSTMLGVILTNQIVGPILAKHLFTYADEVGKADDDNEHHGLKRTIEAFNDGGVLDVPKMVEFNTQTEELLFIMAAKGEIFDAAKEEEEAGADGHGDGHAVPAAEGSVDPTLPEAPAVEAVGVPHDSPKTRLGRKSSLRMITPRRRVEHGGYSFLAEGGDVELTARGGHHAGSGARSGGGEAHNPMWGEEHEQTQGPFPLANALPSWATAMFHGGEK